MSEKATEKWWYDRDADEMYRGDVDVVVIYSGGLQFKSDGPRIVKAVNNYDELASIAGEMAGALSNALNTTQSEYRCGNIYGVFDEDYAPELAALSRYNKWAEKQQ